MERQQKTIENGRTPVRQALLPGVLIALLVGAAVWVGSPGPGRGDQPSQAAAESKPVASTRLVSPSASEVPAAAVPPTAPEARAALAPPAAPEVRTAPSAPIDPSRIGGEGLDVMVIQRDFYVPTGLTGAHAVIFVLEAGVPFPRGDLGHAVVLDLQSGACVGGICRMLVAP